MNVILYLSSKYLKLKKNERGVSAIAIIAFFTIVVSTAAAIIILSAVNGMHEDLMSRIMAKDAHVMILGPGKGLSEYETYIEELNEIEGLTSVVPYYDGQVLIKGENRVWGGAIKAFPPETYSNDLQIIEEFPITSGSFDFTRSHLIVLGSTLATNLGVDVGDVIKIIVHNAEKSFGAQHPFLVNGIFSSGYSEYDANLAFMTFEDAQEIFDSEGYAYGLAIKVEEPENVEKYYSDISDVSPYYQWTWKRLNRNKIISLENEKMLMMIILFVFFAVVFFNILSTMIAMVLDRREAVGIMKAIGLKPKDSLRVFLTEGFIMGSAGSLIGSVFGLFICVSINQILRFIELIVNSANWLSYFLTGWMVNADKPSSFNVFSGEMSNFPMKIQYGDIVFVVLLAVIVSTLAVILPAWKAAKLRPVEVLRND